jgi:hypothetical protein
MQKPQTKSSTANRKSPRTARRPDSTFCPRSSSPSDGLSSNPNTQPCSETPITLASPTVIEKRSSTALYKVPKTPNVTVGVVRTTRSRRFSHPRKTKVNWLADILAPILYLPPRFIRRMEKLIPTNPQFPTRAERLQRPLPESRADSNGCGKSYTKRSAKPRPRAGSRASSKKRS